MAKGIARLGILFSSILTIASAGAGQVGDLSTRDIVVDPATGEARGEWFELDFPAIDEIDPHAIIIGDDDEERQRIETDRLDLPGHMLTLARDSVPAPGGRFGAGCMSADFTLGKSGDAGALHGARVESSQLERRADFDLSGRWREFTGLPMIAPNHGLTLADRVCDIGATGTPGCIGKTRCVVPLAAVAGPIIEGFIAMRVVLLVRIAPKAGILPAWRVPAPGPSNQPRSDGVSA